MNVGEITHQLLPALNLFVQQTQQTPNGLLSSPVSLTSWSPTPKSALSSFSSNNRHNPYAFLFGSPPRSICCWFRTHKTGGRLHGRSMEIIYRTSSGWQFLRVVPRRGNGWSSPKRNCGLCSRRRQSCSRGYFVSIFGPSKNDGESPEQTNVTDCGIYFLENARRLSQDEAVRGKPVEASSLRVLYAELLLARSLYEASERSMLKNIVYPEPSRHWQVGAAPRSYEFESRPAKRRKLLLPEIEAQSVSGNEISLGSEEDNTMALDNSTIEAGASTLFQSSPSCPWMKHL